MRSRDILELLDFIETNLPDMARTFDEGLGIASERYAVNKVILGHLGGGSIRRVLEAPADGLMGIPGMNSVVFARELGADVVVGSPSLNLLEYSAEFWEKLGLRDRASFVLMDEQLPYDDSTFDCVWNYCTFEHFHDGARMVREMARVSRRYVCVVTQNRFNYGYPIHRAYHALRRQPWNHGNPRWMQKGNLVALFRRCGLRVVRSGCVDVAPWFDTFDMHTRGKVKGYMRRETAEGWYWSSLQAGDSERLASNPLIQRLERFERLLVFPLDYLFAHHFYVIAEVSAPTCSRADR